MTVSLAGHRAKHLALLVLVGLAVVTCRENLSAPPPFTPGIPEPLALSFVRHPADVVVGMPVPQVAVRARSRLFVQLALEGPASSLNGTPLIEADSEGVARFTDLVVTVPGRYRFVALAPGAEALASDSFTVAAIPSAARSITAISGGGQSADVGSRLATPYSVRVTDQQGNPVYGAAVRWEPSAGGAVEPAFTSTNVRGMASARHVLGYCVCDQQVVARLSARPESLVVFTATGLPGKPAQLRFVQGPSTSSPDVPLRPTVQVEVFDSAGRRDTAFTGVVTIGFSGLQGSAIINGGTVPAERGLATFPDLSVSRLGSYTLEASAGSLGRSQRSEPFDIVPLAGPPGYQLVILPTLGGTQTTAHAIDESGRVAGSSTNLHGTERAVLWDGTARELAAPAYFQSGVTAFAPDGAQIGFVNENGIITLARWLNGERFDVGSSSLLPDVSRLLPLGRGIVANVGSRAVLFEGGIARDLDPQGRFGQQTIATAVNRNGQVIVNTPFFEFFVWQADSIRFNGAGRAKDINDAGEIAGEVNDQGGVRPAIWRNGVTTIIQLPGIDVGGLTASLINERGEVAGQLGNSNLAFTWYAGTGRPIVANTSLVVNGMNASGALVGQMGFWLCGPPTCAPYLERHAFVWENGVFTDLGVGRVGATTSAATGINDRGDVIGWSEFPTGRRAILWRRLR